MKRLVPTALLVLLALAQPARADYRAARESYESLPEDRRAVAVLGLIAGGDFEAIGGRSFSRLLYDALRSFEEREGFPPDGVLDEDQLARLDEIAQDFDDCLGITGYRDPATGARLLAPRKLVDTVKHTPGGMLFTRADGQLSLIFLSIPEREQGYDALWGTLSAATPEKRIVYQRRLDDHFVVTGYFNTGKFYTWMVKTHGRTAGFTFSWGAQWEETGRKVSVFMANAFSGNGP